MKRYLPTLALLTLALALWTLVAGCGTQGVKVSSVFGSLEATGRVPEGSDLSDFLGCLNQRAVDGHVPGICCYDFKRPAVFCSESDAAPLRTGRPDPPVPASANGAAEKAAPAGTGSRSSGLRDAIKDAEGLKLSPYLLQSQHDKAGRWHVCYGHLLAEDEHYGDRTVEECEALLSADIDKARARARRHLGRDDAAAVELAFWAGGAQFAGLAGGDLVRAVLNDEVLNAVAPDRVDRIVFGLAGAER